MNNVEILKSRVKELGLNVEYLEHEEIFSVEQGIKAIGINYDQGVSTLIFKLENGDFVAVYRRDDRKIDSSELKKALGVKKISMASKEEVLSNFGFTVGAVGVYHPKLNYYMDKYLLEKEKVFGGTGSAKLDIAIRPVDLQILSSATIINCTVPSERSGTIRKRILTGDRPTGRLHIGHYIGSLKNRVALQDEYEQFIEIANVQALTDNFDNPGKVKESIMELLYDYYAVGIDFEKTTVFIQSEVPQIHEIFVYLANFVTIQQISHNPTIKTEIAQKGMDGSTPLGFFFYSVHQAADILCVNADLVPVGKDQAPMVEDSREIGRKFNKTYKVNIFNEPKALFGSEINIPGTDGDEKMGKSLNNCIYLGDTEEVLRKKIFSMKTDPNRIRATDPGKVEGNPVFIYHDAFNSNIEEIQDLKERYTKGTVGDVEVKENLFLAMNTYLTPIRERRFEAVKKGPELLKKTFEGSAKVRGIAQGIVDQMKKAMLIDYK